MIKPRLVLTRDDGQTKTVKHGRRWLEQATGETSPQARAWSANRITSLCVTGDPGDWRVSVLWRLSMKLQAQQMAAGHIIKLTRGRGGVS